MKDVEIVESAIMLFLIVVIIVMVVTSPMYLMSSSFFSYLQEEPEPVLISSIPGEYYLCWSSDDKENITVACLFSAGNDAWDGNVTLPGLGIGEIWLGTEENRFVLNGEPLPMSQNSDNISSFYLYEMKESVLTTWVIILHEDKREWNVIWKARLELDEGVVLPTGELAIFAKFNSYGTPLFIIEE